MKKIIVASIGMLAMEVVAGGQATVSADFLEGSAPEGWVVNNGEYRSPQYDGPVERIVMQYSSGDTRDDMTVHAFTKEGVSSHVATFTGASSAASFDFPETTDFRAFRLVSTNNLALSSFTALVAATSLDAPAAIAVSNNITGTSFDAYWGAVDGATGYKVYVWTNAVVGASAGTPIWEDAMKGATNAYASSKLGDDKFAECFDKSGWTRSDKAGYPTGEAGTIRIGIGSENGWIQTPPIELAEDDMAVKFLAKAVDEKSNGKSISIERISGGIVTCVGEVTLSKELQEFFVPLPEWESGDSIRFNSITNGDRRVVVGAVTVLSGYSDGHLEPAYIVDGLDVGAVTKYSFADLPSEPVLFAVEAYGRRGASSEKTEAVEVDLANPEKAAVLNACPLSSLDGNVYSQNFDSLAAIGNEWLNGTTLRYWQAYRKDSPSTSITHNAGGASSGGLYALCQNAGLDVRALGGLSTQSDAMSWGMAFTNDTGVAIRLVSVSYEAQQWGTRNTVAHNLTLSCLVADGLNWMKDETDGWSECCSTEARTDKPETPVTTIEEYVPAEGVTLNPGQVLYLKWTNVSPQSGSAAMFGIDDVTVTFGAVEKSQGFAIRLANK